MVDIDFSNHSEIISYMPNEVIKIEPKLQAEDRYFNLKIKQKDYPSCYHYNVLVMLAKKLIKDEEKRKRLCKNRLDLDTKLAMRIISNRGQRTPMLFAG